jgi:hypothetical protein
MGNLDSWQIRRDSEDERQRRAILNGPLPKNDSALFKATRCRVLRQFCVGGKPLLSGSECTLPRHEALSLEAAGKVELLDLPDGER